MFPWLEARYIIPYAMISFHWQWWQAFPLAIAGNILPIPFILLFFKSIEKFLRRYTTWARIMDWLFTRTRRKADKKIQKYHYLGLLAFVAAPIPFTGAWSGALIAYLFGFQFSKSLLVIFLGLIIAAIIMIAITLYVSWFLTYLGVNI